MPSDLEEQIRRGENEDIYRSRVRPGATDPRTMKIGEIVAEINSLRESVDRSAQRMVHLTQTLYAHSRRNASSDSTATAYVAFASAWGRLAGAIQQGLRRTAIADKVLERALGAKHEEDEIARKKEVARQAREAEKQRAKPDRPNPLRNEHPLRTLEGDSLEDLLKLYGAGIVPKNADR